MPNLTESAIESLAIQELAKQGYIPIHGADIAPGSENEERASFEETIKTGVISSILCRQ